MKKAIGLFLLAALFVAQGCKKRVSADSAAAAAEAGGVTVYVAGGLFAPDASGLWTGHAICWKNGVATALTTGYSMANSITLNGNDVYVTGWLATGTGAGRAVYWKNGNAVVLTDGQTNARATGIAIDGTDVYVSGWITGTNGANEAAYWKNGVLVPLAGDASYSEANGIAVGGGDVYVAGEFMTGGSSTVMIWKNGVAMAYTDYPFSYALCIAIADSNVYIGGTSSTAGGWGNSATCWENNVPLPFATGLTGTQVQGIAVSGPDVYTVGTIGISGGVVTAGYWKNGRAVAIAGAVPSSYAAGVAVNGEDVYIAGGTTTLTGHDYAFYWKNGSQVMLSESGGSIGLYANGIAVQVPRVAVE